jgi:hypothetical protein
MKLFKLRKIAAFALLNLSALNIAQAQCSVSSNILIENFNTPTLTTVCGGPGDGVSTSMLPAGHTKGAYAASCSGSVNITNNTMHCFAGGPEIWKTSTETGNDGGGAGDYALLVDPCGSIPDGSVWCTSVNVTAGQKYNFSAMISSPWLQEKPNDPDVYLTIGGVQVGSNFLVEQYTSSGATPYQQLCYTYTIPSSGTMDFCINVKQRTGGVATTPGSGSYGANGQGNDVLIDDIKIDLVTGAGCTSGSSCTITTGISTGQGPDSYTNYPSPFNEETVLKVSTSFNTPLSVKIINLKGDSVYESAEFFTNQEISLGKELASGVYMLQINYGTEIQVIKIVKL